MIQTVAVTDETDVLIVGSGPGGAVTAALAAEAGLRVTVCEEGPAVAPGATRMFSTSQMAAQYRCGGITATLGRPPIAYAEARCVGGGSEVNSGLYHRPPPDVVRQWAAGRGLDGFTVDDLHARCEEIEGLLEVGTSPAPIPEMSRVLQVGADRLGWQAQEVPRWFRYPPLETPGRRTMVQTFLPRALAAGASLLPNTRVRRILCENGTAVGVEAIRDGKRQVLRGQSVVCCAGAIQTPALMQRSGLRSGATRSLQLHPTVKIAAEFDDPIADEDVPVHQVKEFSPWCSFGGSASGPGQVALVLSDSESASMLGHRDPRHFAVYYAAIVPDGRGKVRAIPGASEPIVTFGLTRMDLDRLSSGASRLALLLLEGGARRLFASVRGSAPIQAADEIGAAVSRIGRSTISLMTVHLTSTVPLSGWNGPVDSWGKSREVDNLYVNDASVLPSAPGVNPQGTIMAIAHRNAAHWIDAGWLS